MAIISPHSPEDRRRHVLDGMIYDLQANVFNEPTNYYANYRMADVDHDNNPDGLVIGMPEDPEGLYVYLSEKDAGPETCEAQNTEPIPIDEPYYVVNEPRIGGHKPTTSLNAAPIARPPAPEIEVMPDTDGGFEAGHYWLTYTWMDQWGKQTSPAPAVRTVTPLAQGQHMKVGVPDPPEGAVIICFYLSRANGGIATIRFQDQINVYFVRPTEWTLKGPWKNGAVPPLVNQTVRPENKKPNITLIKAYLASGALARQGLVSARITTVDEDGRESAPSPWSDPILMSQEDAEAGLVFKVDFAEESREDPNLRYNVYLDFEGNTEFRFSDGDKNSAQRPIQAPMTGTAGRSPSGSQIVNPVQFGNTGNIQNATSQTIIGGGSRTSTAQRNAVITSGQTALGATSGQTGVLTQAEAPEVQMVEVDPPDAPLDPPVGVGAATIESPGDYWVRLSYYSRGRETVPSEVKKVSLSTGETFRVRVPDPVNAVPNSQVPVRDSKGFPFDWLLDKIRGSGFAEGIFRIIDGVLDLDSLGAKAAGASPSAVFEFAVDRARDYAVGGTLAAKVTSGGFRALLTELDAGGSTIGSSTTIKEIVSSGEVRPNMVFGPSGQAWQNGTAKARVTFDMTGTTRNLIGSVKEFYVHRDIPHKIRRREAFPKGFKLPANSSPASFIRWLKTSSKGVELPPFVNRRAPEQALIDSVDFGEGSANFPTNWTKAGTTAVPTTGAAITGDYGFNVAKTTSSDAVRYMWRDVTPITRAQMGVHATFRVNALPTAVTVTGTSSGGGSLYDRARQRLYGSQTYSYSQSADVAILAIKNGHADGLTNTLGIVTIGSYGELWYATRDVSGNLQWQQLATGIDEGDVIDLELIATGAGTSSGALYAGAGKNGATRTFGAALGANWTNMYAKTAQVGPSYNSQPATEWDFDIDDVVITEDGDTLGSGTDVPLLEPLPAPDRPHVASVTEFADGFEQGFISSSFVPTRTPSDSTTTIGVNSGSAIGGAYGLRIQDTGTATTSQLYLTQTFTDTEISRGFRARYRIVARPSTSSINLMEVLNDSGQTIAHAYIDSAGDIYSRARNADGSFTAAAQLADNVTNGTVVTLELVTTGTGLESGMLSSWIEVGGTGDPNTRNLMSQTPAKWTNGKTKSWRFGGFAEGSASTTFTLDIDDIVVTEGGEITYVESSFDGLPVYQAYAHYLADQPQRDDLWLRDLGFAVIPGETYTFAIWHRHAGVLAASQPYTWKAYDQQGNSYTMGYPHQDVGGAIGTTSWEYKSLTFTVPSAQNGRTDCYEVWMTSPGVGGGEYTAQLPAFSRGEEALHFRRFTESGTAFGTIDTETPQKAPWDHAESRWLGFGLPVDVPADGSATVLWASSDSQVPNLTEAPWQEDKSLVPQKRYLHFQITTTCPDDTARPPVVQAGSPYLENAQFLAGQQIPVLLRDDLTEFPGGAVVVGDPVFREYPEYDVYFPRGRAVRHQRYPPVGSISGFTIRTRTREAEFEITKNCLGKLFVLELGHRRYRIKLLEQVEFGTEAQAPMPAASGVWYADAVADVSGAEVIQHGPITGLPQAGYSAINP